MGYVAWRRDGAVTKPYDRAVTQPYDFDSLFLRAQRSPRGESARDGNDDQKIRYAIAHKHLLKFSLYGLTRIVEPHDYGIRNGAPQLLAYQVRGESQSGKLPAWRWIVLGHASDFEVLDETFAGSRNAEVHHHITWDHLFARVDRTFSEMD
jgi:hypothetical protein